ncbi:MAG TPA: cation:dicarboxylase symporter family transporter, partial [Spirochaetia bacterium]|nr:cation:dicarboxylase symporter family transporter [Spirochaetia bacterium]
MKPVEKQNFLVNLLTSPWSILIAVAISVLIGLMFKDVAYTIKPFGLMYLYLLQMTVIPIIISAIISSIAGLTRSRGVGRFLARMITVFVLMLIAVAIIGTLGGVLGEPGAGLDEKTRNTLGEIVQTEQSKYAPDLELSLSTPPEKKPELSLIDFFVNMIPKNIFESLSSGRAIELIIFAIIFGVAVGVVKDRKGEFLISIFDALFKAFQKIITWLMIVLPFGLICLLADQIASTGFEILLAMLKFIFIFYIVGICVILLNILIIWRRSHEKLGKVLKALLDPIIVALVTRSSFATLPAAIKSLVQKLGFYERSTNLFFSLGITLGRFGNIIYFAIASIFVAQLYGVDLGIGRYGIIAIGSLFAGIATAGASGISTLNLMAIVLGPLGLPLEAVLIIFMTIDTIADPLRTLLIVTNNMAANSLIVPHVKPLDRRKKERDRGPEEKREIFTTRIKEKGVIVVALEEKDVPPFYFTGIDGTLKGISVQIASALAESLGVKLKLERITGGDQD